MQWLRNVGKVSFYPVVCLRSDVLVWCSDENTNNDTTASARGLASGGSGMLFSANTGGATVRYYSAA